MEPEKYVKLLSEAIIAISPKESEILLAARGIGYICQKKFIEASRDLVRAMKVRK